MWSSRPEELDDLDAGAGPDDSAANFDCLLQARGGYYSPSRRGLHGTGRLRTSSQIKCADICCDVLLRHYAKKAPRVQWEASSLSSETALAGNVCRT